VPVGRHSACGGGGWRLFATSASTTSSSSTMSRVSLDKSPDCEGVAFLTLTKYCLTPHPHCVAL
jgi:hypothetical protein